MNNKLVLGIILIILIIILAIFLSLNPTIMGLSKDMSSNENADSNENINTSTATNSGVTMDEFAPELKVFGSCMIIGTVNNIDGQNVIVTIQEINNYTYLKSQEKLIDVGDNITIHFTGTGNEAEWKTKSLTTDISFGSKIRCLDGRINSNDQFTKEDCYWEANEEDVLI